MSERECDISLASFPHVHALVKYGSLKRLGVRVCVLCMCVGLSVC